MNPAPSSPMAHSTPTAPLSPALREAAPEFARIAAAILADLIALIARGFLRTPMRVTSVIPLCNYIGRTTRRLARLMARLPAPTPPRAPRPGRSGGPAPIRLPTTKGWLIADLKYEAANFASQLNHLLNRPESVALLAHFPQAGRILRPICRMLGLDHPALARAPRKPSPRQPPSPAPAFAGLGCAADQARGEGRADAPSGRAAQPPAVAPSVFLPRPPQELCPRLLTRWPWVPHPNAKPKPT